MTDASMIFDPVARTVINARIPDTTRRIIISDLIGALAEHGWNTPDQSLERFLDDLPTVSAFADHDIHLADRRCCDLEFGPPARPVVINGRPA
ncbi:hypothetical protein ACFCYX_19325 [Streptomyces populi]|uniref:hypothetical protein n=1 Tax=Streptomyces populi TaxID=2058924 RepID=UPI0035DA89D8